MDRKQIYAFLKEHDLGEIVKQRFGDNYTRVSTKDLEKVIYDYDASLVECPCDAEEPQQAPTTKHPSTDVDSPFEAACLTLLAVLKDSGLLDDLLEKL